MHKVLCGIVMACALGCGDPGPSTFVGVWKGPTTVRIDGLSPTNWAGTLLVSETDGEAIKISNLCPDGVGSVLVTPETKSAHWSGSIGCNPIAFSDCSVVFTINQISMAANPDGTLAVQGTGTGTGCNTTRAMVYTFSGTK